MNSSYLVFFNFSSTVGSAVWWREHGLWRSKMGLEWVLGIEPPEGPRAGSVRRMFDP